MRMPSTGHQVADGDALGRDRLLGKDAEPSRNLLGGELLDVDAVEDRGAG